MELLKKEIQVSLRKTEKQVQITLDRDMNVPDSRPDMEKLIQNRGEVRLEEIEVLNDRIRVKGALHYKGLYHTAEAGSVLSSLSGSFELEEYINADEITGLDCVKVTAELDDLNVMMIHSRKLGIRALITFHAVVSETKGVEGAVKVEGGSIEQLYSKMNLTQMAFHKRDTCRVKGELILAASKPNIHELLWDVLSLRSPETRLLDGKIQVRGELALFFLYKGEEEHVPVQHVEWELPFVTEVPCAEAREGMIGHIQVLPGFCQLEVKPDEDGEERILSMEVILNLDMKGYEEEEITLLKDLYSTEKNIIPARAPFQYENLIVKNNAKTKVQRRVSLKPVKGKILQLIHVDGNVKIDEMERREDGIWVEGVIMADLLMITDEDYHPLCGSTQMLPFSYLVEAKNIGEKDSFEMEACLEQLHATMLDGEEVEIKAVLSVDIIAFSMREGELIKEIREKNFDYEQLKQIPGIGIYIAEKEEPVWNVAKAYSSTVELIRQMNQIDGPTIKPGQRVLVMKKVREVL